jgi:hypothetical protein
LAGFVAGVLAQDRPHQTLEAVTAPVGLLPVQFAQYVDDCFGACPGSRGIEGGLLAATTDTTTDIFVRFLRHI